MTLNSTCTRCSFELSEQMLFCPGCGAKLLVRRRGYLASALLGAVLVLAICIALQVMARDGRVRPAPHPSASAASSDTKRVAQSDPPELASLRAEVERNPEDMTKVKLLVGILADRLRGNPEASGELVFEAIDLLSRILHHEPNDPTALVTMADLSFDQRAFSKALSFYERYLKVSPDDLGARARYASTLTFLGRYDDSVSELKGVLRSDPKNFPALAYLAITYAQKGDLQEARKSASIALSLAPSEEAKARFSGFVASLGEPGRGELNKQPEGAQTGVAGFIQSIKSNPVAGDKFRSYEGPSDGVLRLKFVDFPMAQMPPFAKQKFFDRLREGLKTNAVSGLSALEFVDADSGVLLDRLSLAD